MSGAAGAGVAGNATTHQETLLLKMESVQGVLYNPTVPTLVTLTEAAYITRIWTYHYGATIGTKEATIALQDTTTGATFGPWKQLGYKTGNFAAGSPKDDPANVLGPPDNYWVAYPAAVVPAGTYRVIDSDPATWSYTADQGNRGLTWIYGWYGAPPAASNAITVMPTATSQTFQIGDVTVILPARLLSAPADLAVATSTTASSLPLPTPDTQIIGAFDISLGSSSSFNADVTLEFAYDPTKLDPSVPEGENLWVSAWDSEHKRWTLQPIEIDATRHHIVVRTRHLSTWIYWKLKGYAYVAAATGYSPFEIYYHPGHTQPRTDVAATYTMRDLANDVLATLTTARQAYADAGFVVPNYQVKAIITDAGDSNMDPYTGNIFLDRKELTTLEILRHDSGHELFHVVQNQYFNIWGMDNRRWWIEGTPDYASSVVVWNGQTPLPELTATYFDESLTLYDNVHAYQNSQFVHYLVSRRNLSFKALWDAVATNSMRGDNGLQALQNYVASATGKTFEQVWADFVEYALFDPSLPMTDLALTAFKLTDSAPSGKRTVEVPSLAAKAIYVAVTAPASGATTRTVAFSATGLTTNATVELWQMTGTTRSGAQLKSVLVDSTSRAVLQLGANDGVEAVVINSGASPCSATVTATSGQAVISSVSPNPVAPGASLTLTGTGFGASAAGNQVYWDTATLSASTWSDTSIGFVTPASATSGTHEVYVSIAGVTSNTIQVSVSPGTASGNYTLNLSLNWGTDNCTKQQTVGQYQLLRSIPVTVDSSGNFSINYVTSYGYDNWTIQAAGSYVGTKLLFSSGKWFGDVYSASGSRMIANDSGTFTSNGDGTIAATYKNVMTEAEATYLSYATPDTCSGAATVTASMSKN